MSDDVQWEEELESVDDGPKNGEWVDNCDVVAAPTDEELEMGRLLGENINTDDDDDNGDDAVSFGSAGSDQPRALAKAKRMKTILLEYGVPEVSIQLRPGRPNSFGVYDAGFFVSDMSHHTVSRFGSNLTPVLGLCTYGRSDLPGPLCNGYGGYDLTYRIITFGYANHPGYGGPLTVPALTSGRFTIPKDNARRYAWGTEWEGGLSAADWDRNLRNPRNGKQMDMCEFMGRVNAGLSEALEIHPGAHTEHKTWTSRKIDRLNYSQDSGIMEANKYRKKTSTKKFPEGDTIDISNVTKQFRIARGVEKGETSRTWGVKVVQQALGVPATGKVTTGTLDAWEKFETAKGVKGRARVPDAKTLRILAKENKFNVVK